VKEELMGVKVLIVPKTEWPRMGSKTTNREGGRKMKMR
jgi:hypothetical protein